MKEKIGNCKDCGKEIFCLDGFLNGVITDSKELICFECSALKTEKNRSL